jgi:phosphoribosylglycinamide formyltransferase-1
LRVAVLVSGRGSNLQALLDAAAPSGFAVVGVFSDRATAPALERARTAGVPAFALDPASHASREAFDAALFDAVDAVSPDLVVCAGYLRILTNDAVVRYAGRMINIHPSLLPLHPGLRTHARALAEGVGTHGASVHYVIPALDAGPVIAQARVPVRPDDNTAALAARVLEREHPLLVECVRMIATGRVLQDGSVVLVDSRPLAEPLLLGDDDRLIEPVLIEPVETGTP